MKIPLLLVLAVTCIATRSPAQSKPGRKLNPAEMAWCNTVYNVLAASVPHAYRDWNFTDVLRSFPDRQPYIIGLTYDYELPEDQSKLLVAAAYKKINDPNSVRETATALKSIAVNALKIMVTANVPAQSAGSLTYCAKMPPTPLALPVPATLSLLGLHTDECFITIKGKADVNGDYYDNAIIFLGKPVIKKKTDQLGNGLSRTSYYVGFDKAKANQLITQNIVVTLKGDAADINAAIKLIDWQKLYGLLSK